VCVHTCVCVCVCARALVCLCVCTYMYAAQVLLCDPGMVASMVDDAQSLRWMQSTWAGVNAIFVESQKRDYALTRLGGCFGTQVMS